MSKLQFTLVGTEDGSNISVFVPGQTPMVAHSSHPNFEAILAGAIEGDESVIDLFDVSQTAGKRFERLSERVTAANGRLYLDGEEVANALSGQVVRFLNEGVDDWQPLVNFFENVQANPNEHSREQLYAWLEGEAFTITEDGLIVGYKSVQSTGDGYQSISSGRAIVNGEVHTGRIPQDIGDVVEMPRGEVTFDPGIGCHTGLHVGTYGYADTFSGDTLLEVHVNPRDVVSVPTDCNAQKMRVCRYTIVDTITKPYATAVKYTDTFDGVWDDENYDDDGWGDGEYEDWDADDEPQATQSATTPYGSLVGRTYKSTDSRRSNLFTVEKVRDGYAYGKSVGADGVSRSRSVDVSRLLSYRYKEV